VLFVTVCRAVKIYFSFPEMAGTTTKRLSFFLIFLIFLNHCFEQLDGGSWVWNKATIIVNKK